jgi:hypothetical protein
LLSGNVPDSAVVLTIDDGYEDFYRLAFPILRKYGVPATFYVTTDFVDGRLWFWWDTVRFMLRRTPRREMTLQVDGQARTFDLTCDSDRQAAWSAIGTVCLTLGSAERQRSLTRLSEELDVDVPEAPPPEYRPVTWPQVQEMAASGIEIGSHTRSHPRLSLTSRADLVRELVESKVRLEAVTGLSVTSFCYPFGRPEDLNERIRGAVRAAGYRNAVVAYSDRHVTDDIFALRRFGVGTDMREFRRVVGGMTIASAQLKGYVVRPLKLSVESGTR